MRSYNDFKKIFEHSRKVTKQKKNIKIKIDAYTFIKYLIKNNIFIDFILSKYFIDSNNDKNLIKIIKNDFNKYKNLKKETQNYLSFLLTKSLKINYLEIKDDIYIKKIHSDIDILVKNNDFNKIKKNFKGMETFEKFLNKKQLSKLKLVNKNLLEIEIIKAFQWSRIIKLNYNSFFVKNKNSNEINHYFCIFLELVFKKIYVDLSDIYHLQTFRDKYTTNVFRKFFLNKREYDFFDLKIKSYNNTQIKDIFPKYKLIDIFELLFFEIKNHHIDILFYAYHIYCIIRFKFFGRLPFYDRQLSKDLKISKKFYTFKL